MSNDNGKQQSTQPRLTASEAVYGFASWLTTRQERTVMSAGDNSSPIVDLVVAFCKANHLPEVREEWAQYLTHPEAP